ncbi:MAG: hypothetical protein ABIP75_14775, partial [Pyrinomonadaceae bacterium]
ALIQNNKIGVDATGLVALSQFEGIQISGGSTNRIIGNVISGNTTAIGAGAGIVSSSIGTRIENNLIGLGIDGVTVIPNATGIILGGQGGIIGGENSGIVTVGNFVTGNLNDQVRLEIGPGGFGIIQGNTLGLDRLGGGSSGTKTGTGSGVGGTTSSGGVKVGGATPGARNVISGNDGDGIQLGVINLGTGVSNVEIVNNYIGTDANGNDANVGNAGNGVYIGSLADLISIHDNRIAYNGLRGVQIPTSSVPAESGFSVEISRNEVFSNGRIVLPDNGMNVDLGILGPTPNDLGDADVGGNGLQNYPLISSATTSGGLVTISGQFNSLPNNRYRLEFFYSANCVNNIPNTISQFLSATYAYTGGTAASVTPFSVQFTIPNGFPVSAQIQSVAINSPLLKTRYRPTALIKQNLPEVENTSEYSPCFTSN